MHEALGWALAAYCANGPDMILTQLIRAASTEKQHLDPWAALSLLLKTDPDLANQLATHITELIAADHSTLLKNTAGKKTILPTISYWLNRLTRLPSTHESDLADFFTLSGRLTLLTPSDALWPSRLADLPERVPVAAPLCLWVEGDARIVGQTPSIGIVGSREMSSYGQRCARQAGRISANHGAVVITGGAMGVDAQANQGALDSGRTPTIAIFAGGLEHIGPARNLPLFTRMCEAGGALVSELPPDTIPYASHFLERNRLIAALSDCVLVAQARYRSGALNTAHWAEQLGRTTLAIPGPIDSPSSAGCNRLLQSSKATILTDLDDLSTFLTPTLFPDSSKNNVPHDFTDTTFDVTKSTAHSLSQTSAPPDLKTLITHALATRSCSRSDLPGRLHHAFSHQDIDVALGILEAHGKISVDEHGMIRVRNPSSPCRVPGNGTVKG